MLRYAECCRPYHRGEQPKTPEALMRSRYAAFALGLGDYLAKTLAQCHPDRAAPAEALARELGRVKERQRFMGLRIVRAEGDEVLFEAKVFERGVDRSFAELSTFCLEPDGWRYASGHLLPRASLPPGFTYDDFIAALGR
jgi:SEC-C motif-containing protein